MIVAIVWHWQAGMPAAVYATDAGLARVARRLLALPSSVLLVALVLPAVKVCDKPVAPYQSSFVYAPNVGGAALIIFALLGPRARGAAITAVAALWLVAMASLNVSKHPATTLAIGVLALIGIVVLGIKLSRRACSDYVAAGVALGHGALATAWGRLLTSNATALYGVTVEVTAALTAVVLAGVWLSTASFIGPPVPRAGLREP